MGKQVNFYMTGKDETFFLEELGQIAPYKIIRPTFTDLKTQFGDKLSTKDQVDLQVYICRGDVEPKIKAEFIKEQGYFWLDFMNSEVVELSRSVLRAALSEKT